MAKKGIGGVISGSIVLFLGAIIITAGVGGRVAANTFLIEPMIGSTLQDIEDQALPALTPAIQDMAYPLFLDGVYTQMQYAFGGDPANLAMFINCSTAMGIIGQTIPGLAAGYPGYFGSQLLATWGMFNDTYSLFGSPFQGVIEWSGAPMTYTLNDAINLTQGTPGGLPGFLVPDPLGDGTPGMLAFLAVYGDPTSVGIPDLPTLAAAYGLASQTHLDMVAGWIIAELFPMVAGAITTQLGWNELMPDATVPNVGDYILAQWAEKVLISAGLGSLDPAATNFEVGSEFHNMTQVKGVWGSIVGGDFLRWYAHDPTLQAEFNLDTATYNDILAWLPVVLPVVLTGVAGEFGLTYIGEADLYLRLFVGQWMEIGFLLPDPLFSMLGSPLIFEIDFAHANVLSNDDGMTLWAELKSEAGIKRWFTAVDDRRGPEYVGLKAEHGLSNDQFDHICDYLELWRSETLIALNIQEEEIALPIWGYDLGAALDDLELYLPIAGGVFAVAGVLLIALFARKRV